MTPKQTKLKCECGQDFERPGIYKTYLEKSPNVHWKWKLRYCDECFKNRSDKALQRLPDLINNILNDKSKI